MFDRYCFAGEQRDDLCRHLGEWAARELGNFSGVKRGPSIGDIQPPIRGKPRQSDIQKATWRRRPTCRNVREGAASKMDHSFIHTRMIPFGKSRAGMIIPTSAK